MVHTIFNHCSATSTEFYDGKFVSKLVNDPVMLRLILEALIVDDLHHKRQSLDLSQVTSEIQGDPEMIFQQVEHHHNQNHRLLISLAKKQSFHFSDFVTIAVFDIIVSGVAAN